MRIRRWIVLPVGCLAAVALFSVSSEGSRDSLEVLVQNFPDVQSVDGRVEVRGTISHTKFLSREGVVVPTAARADITELVELEPIDASGFSHAVLSLQGETKSSSFAPGHVGAFLLPGREPVGRALRDGSQVQFPIEATVTLTSPKTSFFWAEPVRAPLGFPSYRVFLYNTTDKSIEANVYVSLQH